MTKVYQKSTIIVIALATIFLHFLPGSTFEYHRDELLYFSLCNHLDFGYATVPPMTGFMAFIAKSFFGYSLIAVRFFPAILSGLLIYLSSFMVSELNGSFRAQLIASIGVGTSMFLSTIYGVFTPYCFDIFFWTLTIYFLIRFINTNSNYYLLILGATIGLAFLNKYSILFLLISILIVIPFSKHRKVFSNKFFYLGVLICFLIASPNIIWQITNHLPVINHMKELNDSQLANVNRIVFLVEQLILLLPFTLIILPGIVYFLINKQFKEFRLLLSISVVVIFLFFVLRGKSFYTAGLFPFFIVIGAIFIEKVFKNRFIFYTVFMLFVVLSGFMLPLSLPIFKPQKMISYYDNFAKIIGADFLRRDEDGNYRSLPQINADMLGWNEITDKTNKAWLQVKNKNNCFIFCANYGQAGAISIIGKKYGLPEPISFSESFKFWLPLQFKNEISEIVYVVGEDALNSGNLNDTKSFFQEMIVIDSVQNRMAIEYRTKIYLFKNPKSDFNEFWKGQIKPYTK
jgi:MFS family permease